MQSSARTRTAVREARAGGGRRFSNCSWRVYDHEKPRRNGDNAPGIVTISMPEPGILEAHTRSLSQRFLARNREFECSNGVLEFARTGATGGNVGAWLRILGCSRREGRGRLAGGEPRRGGLRHARLRGPHLHGLPELGPLEVPLLVWGGGPKSSNRTTFQSCNPFEIMVI